MNLELCCGSYRLELDRALVMGIINCTPDSFSGDGLSFDVERAVEQGRAFVGEGADILDVGGESSRPGAAPVSEADELLRVIPVIKGLAELGVPISCDTVKPEVMRRAIAAGASMINDINAFRAPGALEIVARSDAALCLMHMQGSPGTMQEKPTYVDVVAEVAAFLEERAEAARASGIPDERIVIDPGFGFGKTAEHNLSLLRDLDTLRVLGLPVLVGLSRKSVLGKLTGRKVSDRVAASIAAALVAVANGAHIVRVHDVAATRDALAVWYAGVNFI